MPGDSVISVTRDTATATWRAAIPGGAKLVDSNLRTLLGLAHDLGQPRGWPVQVWDASTLPGGWVCGWLDPTDPDGWCGIPVEDVPCTRHWPVDEDTADLDALLVEATDPGRHPPGRRTGLAYAFLFLVAVLVLGLVVAAMVALWP